MAGAALGSQGAAMEQRELAALASVKTPQQKMQQKQLLVSRAAAPTASLAWLNAGATADTNVFEHDPATWTAADDPLHPALKPKTSEEYTADLHPVDGLAIVHRYHTHVVLVARILC